MVPPEEVTHSPRRVVVFSGPSLSHERVALAVPHAERRPPIRRADLDEFGECDLVAIVDGVFDSERAVSPREIRDALGRGVRVVGASSMGALRAVEVPDMLGVGRVFDMYRRGELQRDDEVAVLLDSETSRALTEPLVNVRFAVERLVAEGSISDEVGRAIVVAATTLHFHDRTYPNILRCAGLSDRDREGVLLRALRSFDLKAEDALTLLERLDELWRSSHWSTLGRKQPEAEEPLVAAAVELPEETAPDAPVLVWESGEIVPLSQLVDFLAASGRLHVVARRALFRFVAAGGTLGDLPDPVGVGATVQQAFDDIVASWGWKTHEEIHVTLRDLGFGRGDLTNQLLDDRIAHAQVVALCRSRSPEFLRAVRFELLSDDLALKRESLRFGALLRLSALAGEAPPSAEELNDARRAYLCERPEVTWEAIELEAGADDERLAGSVALLARARRAGTFILDAVTTSRDSEGREPAGLSQLLGGAPRMSLSDNEAVETTRLIAARIGVTRIAHVGELERFGLYVTSAYRASGWSSTVGSGKSVTVQGAEIGCVMEEVEKFCQENSETEIKERVSFNDLYAEGISATSFALPYDTRYTASTKLEWTDAIDLVSGTRPLVPAALFSYVRVSNDPLYSPRRGSRVFSSSGLAAGFSVADALEHATCELIERHAIRLAELAVTNPGELPESRWPSHDFIDLATCPDSTRQIVSQIRQAGYEVRVMDITSAVKVPTFAVRMMIPRGHHGVDIAWPGSCAHVSPEVAINRALMEAVQSRVTHLSGAREDYALKARSLGRHERPRPASRGDAFWFRPHVPKKPFQALSGLETGNAHEALSFICRRLTAAGFQRILYRDLSRPEALPAHAVRVIIPGVETTNPFFTGLHARALLVADLLHRHEW